MDMILQKDYFRRNTIDVSKELLGKVLVRNTPDGQIKARIVETEAYLGFDDPGCHAYKGMTPRNAVMFLEAGIYYVYFIYGMYHCLNIVTRESGCPEAVLIRAVAPIAGIDIMQKNRPKIRSIHQLANGPGKLTVALDIDKNFNGVAVSCHELFVLDDGFKVDYHDIVETTRIGLNQGADLPLRYYLASLAAYVSKK